ncbi:MAG: GNAT family N-acetyltransferase [Pseudomonadales bacterium]|nr:GNAT family N-acetyltransferase [Pseudomonadales bacterium]
MKYKIIDKSKSEDIAKLAVCLTSEIMERTNTKAFDVDISLSISLCENFVASGLYHVMAAFDGNRIIGFAAVCESHSLYAQGSFGIIQEFYVLPEYRSKQVGKSLIQEIINYAQQREWKRLELCTPPVPEFDKTVAFYQSNGFEITGGYKMKYAIA